MTLLLSIILIIMIIFIIAKFFVDFDLLNLVCIESEVDGNKYCIRERKNSEEADNAVDALANATQNCKKLIKHLAEKRKDDEITIRLIKGFNPKRIQETLPDSDLVAYSENKGEKLAFCLNTKKNGQKMIDENTLMFVVLHELSHIACDEVGHTPKFWRIFKELLIESFKIGIYKPVDYKKNPKNYCGMTISDNPYFDL